MKTIFSLYRSSRVKWPHCVCNVLQMDTYHHRRHSRFVWFLRVLFFHSVLFLPHQFCFSAHSLPLLDCFFLLFLANVCFNFAETTDAAWRWAFSVWISVRWRMHHALNIRSLIEADRLCVSRMHHRFHTVKWLCVVRCAPIYRMQLRSVLVPTENTLLRTHACTYKS